MICILSLSSVRYSNITKVSSITECIIIIIIHRIQPAFFWILCFIIWSPEKKRNHYILKLFKLHSCGIEHGTKFIEGQTYPTFTSIWKLLNKHCISFFSWFYLNSTSNTWWTTTDNVGIRHPDWIHAIERLRTFHQMYENLNRTGNQYCLHFSLYPFILWNWEDYECLIFRLMWAIWRIKRWITEIRIDEKRTKTCKIFGFLIVNKMEWFSGKKVNFTMWTKR